MRGSWRAKPTRGCRRRRATGSNRCGGGSGSAMRRGVDTLAMGVLCAAFAGALAAQSTDAPRAPRIIGGAPAQPPAEPAAESPVPVTAPLILPTPTLGLGVRPPNAARLAPLPEERQDTPDEIIVIGQGWRLP